ncbi:hypothetical protein Echvi_4352 [Echinicola vietnamensis DSM 17526]|uniref:Uncharacterized protein n=1 Tax=Echinicola vietnamensis (strain DSM 17526 / LMG 23754 / KMM 6221) TaxID=926556 RepID=L0G4T7_ECHVK|nr:hypothetical protein Echvi_4352 [Echinicola vietnamensis DSM 17526]
MLNRYTIILFVSKNIFGKYHSVFNDHRREKCDDLIKIKIGQPCGPGCPLFPARGGDAVAIPAVRWSCAP